ncbi:hypothetical protein [Candidatus Azobacteroides pseudotrichonymphae]|uniref:hypothetical protein n=1 Tax=Candidatus Azobacteroides pseudotrichonymphae TaxID=511435 RepID=UPI0005A02462|nr:hypothetical protein [Candidatus Azobacteroides pseudotrichonymphae]
MKKLVLFAAFFSVICFGSCNKNKGSQEGQEGSPTEGTEQVGKNPTSDESDDSQKSSPSEEEPKANEEKSPEGGK